MQITQETTWYMGLKNFYYTLLLLSFLVFISGWANHDDVCVYTLNPQYHVEEMCEKNYQLAFGYAISYFVIYLFLLKTIKLTLRYIILGKRIEIGDYLKINLN